MGTMALSSGPQGAMPSILGAIPLGAIALCVRPQGAMPSTWRVTLLGVMLFGGAMSHGVVPRAPNLGICEWLPRALRKGKYIAMRVRRNCAKPLASRSKPPFVSDARQRGRLLKPERLPAELPLGSLASARRHDFRTRCDPLRCARSKIGLSWNRLGSQPCLSSSYVSSKKLEWNSFCADGSPI